jgi:hypothetical protein
VEGRHFLEDRLFERLPDPAAGSEAEAAYLPLVPAQVMAQLVAHGSLDLCPEQLGIVAEVSFQRVLVDHDAVRIGIARDRAADVVTISMMFTTAVGNDHRRTLEQLAELLGEIIERLNDELVERAQRTILSRQRSERFAAFDQTLEIGIGQVVAHQQHGSPGGKPYEDGNTHQEDQQVVDPIK